MNRKKRFAVHTLFFDTENLILRMIRNCAPHVEIIYVAYSDLPWDYNPNARQKFKNKARKEILNQSEHRDKIVLIEGDWKLEEEQRNACLERAKADGMDYLIIHDCDEFYSEEDYEANLTEIENNPDWDSYTTPWCCYWKNLDYVVENPEGSVIVGTPPFAVNCNRDVRFSRARVVDKEAAFQLRGLCHHLSYVMTDEEVYSKISTWGHAHQFNRDAWFLKKWKRWNEQTTNLHPVEPTAWRRAVRQHLKVPEILSDFESPKVVQYKPSGFEWIQDIGRKIRRVLTKKEAK